MKPAHLSWQQVGSLRGQPLLSWSSLSLAISCRRLQLDDDQPESAATDEGRVAP